MKINDLRILSVILALAFICLSVDAQKKLPFNNRSLKYSILKTAAEIIDTNRLVVPRYYVKVLLSGSRKNVIKKLSYDEWMNLLLNKNTDWAANLCLYDLFEKDAVIERLFIETRKEWLKCCRREDVEYWKKNLPH